MLRSVTRVAGLSASVSSKLPLIAFQRAYSSDDYAEIRKVIPKLLVANRGEIACRVFKTAKKMGIKTVAVYSDADAESKHVRMADEAVCIGPAPSNESYLLADRIIASMKMTGAVAVHPGFGFLSEKEEFVDAVEKAGLIFLGPQSHAMASLGDKITSKLTAIKAKVNTIPGVQKVMRDTKEAVAVAQQIGYPVMIKASGGGGGKGMRIAWNDKEAAEGFRLATDEAKSSFKDDRLFVEKFIDHGRHIEIQLVADTHGNVVYFPERECSIQRRNQKVIEESPSMLLSPETRKKMGMQAAALAKSVGYRSAGTCEFIADQKENFYFLEMNTRLQVEHPITEYITGVDLVEQMIRVGAGLPLSVKQEDIKINGHATEARVYAEDPYKNFMPSIGRLTRYVEPMVGHENVRCDSGLYEGLEISMYYDPMICKLITYGKDRTESLEYMRKALDSYIIRGVRHNVAFLRSVIDHPRYLSGTLATAFIAEEWPQGFKGYNMTPQHDKELLASTAIMHYKRTVRDGDAQSQFVIKNKGVEHDVKIVPKSNDQFDVVINGQTTPVTSKWNVDTILMESKIDGRDVVCHYVAGLAAGLRVQYVGTEFDVTILSPKQKKLWKYLPEKVFVDTSNMVLSPMPGRVVSVSVKVGDKVDIGDEVCCLEAMKMSNILRAETKGTVKKVNAVAGSNVAADDCLILFEKAEPAPAAPTPKAK